MRKYLMALAMTLVMWAGVAQAYDATYNFTQANPEIISGFKAKAGPTKGGPYPVTFDCKKPALKADSTYDCVVPGLSYNPVYGVVTNYDSTGKELATSAEATGNLVAGAPGSLKFTFQGVMTLTPQ
jgi:hypothetical protein